jgi:hypothetical protein
MSIITLMQAGVAYTNTWTFINPDSKQPTLQPVSCTAAAAAHLQTALKTLLLLLSPLQTATALKELALDNTKQDAEPR